MKFLAIDTSGARLSVVAANGEHIVKIRGEQSAKTHSVRLMGEVERALKEANLTAQECDFFACTIGPGSFTGIRIGIATVKGLCLACNKKAVAVTSLDAIAYAETGKRIAFLDALHGNVYACAYGEEGETELPPSFLSQEEFAALSEQYAPVTDTVDTAEGLYRAVLKNCENRIDAKELTALYLRKSSAEEQR